MNEYFGLFCALVCFIVIVFWLHFCPSKIPAKVGTHMAIKVGHLYCRIYVEFSDTLLMNLLHKIRDRKICVGIVVSNVDRIRVPTVDDQP